MEFELNGSDYICSNMDVKKAFHLSRRLTPVLAALIPVFKDGKSVDVEALSAFTDVISSMKDEAAEECLMSLLSSVKKKEAKGNGLMPLVKNGNIMFDDLTLKQIYIIAYKSLVYNFKDFFVDLPFKLPEEIAV